MSVDVGPSRVLSGRRYKAYQRISGTGITEIPAHWESIRLRRVATFRPSPDEIRGVGANDAVTFLPMEVISDRGTFDRSSARPLAEISTGYSYFRNGDVIRAKVTPCFENGKGAVVDRLTGGYGFGTTELFVIRPGDRLDARFLYYLTMSDPFVALGTATIYGAHGVKRVRDEFVRDFTFGLPPLSEQRRIAESLHTSTGRLDRLIAMIGGSITREENRRTLVCLLLEKRIAPITAAVTGQIDVRAMAT